MKEGFLEATESKIQWAKDEFLRVEDPAGYKASPWPMVEELIAEVRRLQKKLGTDTGEENQLSRLIEANEDLRDRIDLLRDECATLRNDRRARDREVALECAEIARKGIPGGQSLKPSKYADGFVDALEESVDLIRALAERLGKGEA